MNPATAASSDKHFVSQLTHSLTHTQSLSVVWFDIAIQISLFHAILLIINYVILPSQTPTRTNSWRPGNLMRRTVSRHSVKPTGCVCVNREVPPQRARASQVPVGSKSRTRRTIPLPVEPQPQVLSPLLLVSIQKRNRGMLCCNNNRSGRGRRLSICLLQLPTNLCPRRRRRH